MEAMGVGISCIAAAQIQEKNNPPNQTWPQMRSACTPALPDTGSYRGMCEWFLLLPFTNPIVSFPQLFLPLLPPFPLLPEHVQVILKTF